MSYDVFVIADAEEDLCEIYSWKKVCKCVAFVIQFLHGEISNHSCQN